MFDPPRLAALVQRLRQPGWPGTVAGSLPVLFFGELHRATVATIGINPSWQEYLAPDRRELGGPQRRFESLGSLGATSRESVDDAQARRALAAMQRYFADGGNAYQWFRPLGLVLDGLEASFVSGSAVHLDLVQEATDPAWSALWRQDRLGAANLLRRDLAFLRWQLAAFPLELVVCTSRMVADHVLPLLDAQVVAEGRMARLTWFAARGSSGGRNVAVVGWNIPLLRPTGLNSAGQVELGRLLRREAQRA